MKQNRNTSKRKLSISEMLEPLYCDRSLSNLREQFDLEIAKFDVDSYWHYTPKQLIEHYNLEIKLANQLLKGSTQDRVKLYSTLYDQLYTELPFHPQLVKKENSDSRRIVIRKRITNLKRYLQPNSTFLEIGPGDCALSFEVAKHVKKVWAVDVSKEITNSHQPPNNFELILSNGTSIDIPPGSVDVAFSNQLMEHLHPDDAKAQLEEIFRALAPNGEYICITPHRFSGPADVSRFFDTVAKGFHLKEYTAGELYTLFRSAGFSKVYLPRRIFGRNISFPIWPAIALEFLIQPFPHYTRQFFYHKFRRFLRLDINARK